jgi:hypothetical protein
MSARHEQAGAVACRHLTANPEHTAVTKSVYTTLILAAIALVLAFVLNPSPERHRARIAEVIAERSPLAEVLGIGQLTAFTSSYHSLGVASYTKVGDRTVSVGAFGMIFVSE